MYLDYQEFFNCCQNHLEEGQKLWEKEMQNWQRISQQYLNGVENLLKPYSQDDWCSQTMKETLTAWEKGWHFWQPWFQNSFIAAVGPSPSNNAEMSKKLDQLGELQTEQNKAFADQKLEIDRQAQEITEHKKKVTELTRQLTLLKKEMTAQKKLTKSQAIELEAFKDNLSLQEKTLAACETHLKAIGKAKKSK
jgi:hypothetical protein